MNRITWRYGFPRRYDPRRRVRRGFAASPIAEPLEDRTLLSLNWSLVGPGLQAIFIQMQASANDHLLNPNAVGYSLPLVGTQLGQASDPVGQVFASLAQQIASTFQGDPPVTGQKPEDTVVSDLETALASYQPQVANTGSSSNQATFSVQAATSTPLTETVALELGLPGLAPLAVTANQAVGVQLTFTLDLKFGLDQTGLFVDPTQNGPSSPLLQVELKANLGGWAGTAGSLNGVHDQVTDDAHAPSSLDVPVTFNASASGNIYNFSASDIDQINFASSAAATVDLDYALDVADAPALTLDLGVQWPLNSVVAGTSPFDGPGDGQVPTVAFDAGVNLSSVGSELDPANSPLIQALDKQIKPLQDVVDFFYQPLPVLSNLGITVTPRALLQDFLPMNEKGFLTLLDTLHDLVSGAGSFSFPSGAEVTFASSTLPSTADPRRISRSRPCSPRSRRRRRRTRAPSTARSSPISPNWAVTSTGRSSSRCWRIRRWRSRGC